MSSVDLQHARRREHSRIREQAARAAQAAQALVAGDQSRRPSLGQALSVLRDEIEAHLEREDQEAAVATDSGPRDTRAAGVRAVHREFAEVLDFCRGSCGQKEHELVLARRACDVVELVCEEVRSAERRGDV